MDKFYDTKAPGIRISDITRSVFVGMELEPQSFFNWLPLCWVGTEWSIDTLPARCCKYFINAAPQTKHKSEYTESEMVVATQYLFAIAMQR